VKPPGKAACDGIRTAVKRFLMDAEMKKENIDLRHCDKIDIRNVTAALAWLDEAFAKPSLPWSKK
jgi:hypothetical protein